MRKTLTAVAAAATIGVATVAAPTTADARWGWWGPALGAFAVGAIVGGALARPYYYGGYYGGYYPAYSYYPAGYYGCWVGGGARSIALALTSVRRTNWTCSFPASSFHEDAIL